MLKCATCGKIGCPNLRHMGKARVNCEHENEVVTSANSTEVRFRCPDCGAETREDRT